MAQKPPVHVELKEQGWAVVREGRQRAISTHQTQSEAAQEGRELARRDKTEFFLHAQDGHVREHRTYGEEPRAGEKGIVDQAAATVNAVAGATGAVAGAVGVTGGATEKAGTDEDQETTRSKSETGEKDSNTEEASGLTDARHEDDTATPEERYAGYEVYSQDGERLGKPDGLFVDENDNPEYVGIRTDPADTNSILIPAEVVTVDDAARRMLVSRPTSAIQAGPSLGPAEELTPGLEERVRVHYGLTAPQEAETRAGYGAYYPGARVPGATTTTAEDDAVEDREESRVRRSEEELRVGIREREAGAVRVRKRVLTERERIVVPKKRVEVTVERIPVEGERAAGAAGSAEIGEDEIVVPIIEEEVVVEKRPVVKEEIRIRKEVVEDTEVVEEDVRREEIEVDDQTGRRDG